MNKKTRVKIPDELAAEVLFLSDKTCCVCRDSRRVVQIHHVDENPSNNAITNLAVLCNDCHSEAHTNQAFARNLSADLITRYNESWRATVKARLNIGGKEADEIEYSQQVLLEILLIPHQWKIEYMAIYPGHFRNLGKEERAKGKDIWEVMVEFSDHQYTFDEWKKYHVLFDAVIPLVNSRLERALMIYGEAVPTFIKLEILRSTSQLNVARTAYLTMPNLYDFTKENTKFFKMKFTEVIRILSNLSALADKERKREQ